ncbi:hypothetical protein BHE74_00041074 [Ensete ventricosum]|uniref:Uncharacterized protein n=1 Tax=Ensete ventricosum TaxID=4639 RepID=A0A444FXX2_ENSVE|nr:hypothetical protein B296_00040416 [Ensete ventricosum]RWW27471.1 hypothetical protein GW17_00008087 [Ensete ventricosum]RWW52495.1 hypothetical protein BHE74_00041074 [Ensete ventricosum]RZR81215.1 hypothetical protein BHM03_00007403 [Ensete ventricosum]
MSHMPPPRRRLLCGKYARFSGDSLELYGYKRRFEDSGEAGASGSLMALYTVQRYPTYANRTRVDDGETVDRFVVT